MIVRNRHRNIGLIGFMATGKTVVGKNLADKLGLAFVDTDELVMEEAGKSIPEIFEEDGEAIFRELECEIVKQVCQSNSQVISFGGGVVLSPTNTYKIKENTITILLTASNDTIHSRIRTSSLRPLLTSMHANLEDSINELLAQRDILYRTAMDFTVCTDGKSVSEVVEVITRRIQH